MKYPPVNYHEYLQLDQLLDSQALRSVEFKKPAHDEMLFIIVHQAYELWFKQMLFEVDSILEIFKNDYVADQNMGLVINRLNRIVEIQKLMLEQIRVLETMTPLDFLEFRDMLYPASGFQSYQFRLFENRLGLKPDQRLSYNANEYHASLSASQAENIRKVEKQPSLFDGVEKWLERTPFLQMDGFDFWSNYQKSVLSMFKDDENVVKNHQLLSASDKERNLKQIEASRASFLSLFNETEYKKSRESGAWRLSYKAIHAALLIQIYRDQPVLQLPFKLITALLDIDESITNWRYRHALMAKRMLGTKIGTGGSSGYQYLKDSAEKHKIFSDFFQLTTFFIPRSTLPKLPEEIEKRLGFYYNFNR